MAARVARVSRLAKAQVPLGWSRFPANPLHQWNMHARLRDFHCGIPFFADGARAAKGINTQESIRDVLLPRGKINRPLADQKFSVSIRPFPFATEQDIEWAQDCANETEFRRHFGHLLRPDLNYDVARNDRRHVEENRRFRKSISRECEISLEPKSPQPDMLNTFCANYYSEFPMAGVQYGSSISPLWHKSGLRLQLPFELLNFKGRKGSTEKALLQNCKTVKYIFQDRLTLFVDAHRGDVEAAKASLEKLSFLSEIITPFKAQMYHHRARVGKDGSLLFVYKLDGEWRFPEDMEEASIYMMHAARLERNRFSDGILPILQRIETDLRRRK